VEKNLFILFSCLVFVFKTIYPVSAEKITYLPACFVFSCLPVLLFIW